MRKPPVISVTVGGRRWLPGLVACLLAWSAASGQSANAAEPLPSVPVGAVHAAATASYEGSVEAVRQAVLAAQVPGNVVELHVKAGDRVRAGQLLLRIDARAAEQGAAASAAQVAAARATLEVAAQEVARKRQLYAKNYIAKAALDQAEGQYRAAQAQVNAQTAQARAAQTQAGFHAVRAPFDGVVSAVTIERGDMAMPGRPLLTVYDPAALRVTAAVPSAALRGNVQGVRLTLATQAESVAPTRVQVLPTVDAASLTQQVRADLPAALAGVVPGQFARLSLPGAGAALSGAPQRLFVPAPAIVRRAEMTGVYVLDEQGQPLLRQVRLGLAQGDQVEVLSGLSAGERVVTTPQAAARRAPVER
ncbi:efflux RND transporter periplasmic adaptor subunit [Ottowia testudinis]|uniref:Efflux RND transporter periplasmic adaptor subunit n=1 Tax=Ottowia testudinis TaxID=2816950 RepID=A0A975CDA8_9BURK|nr:efflux RND transporter periplasmic adaptor subunit [Ottowia testudinis]QTD44155.1 efflux RND transporter periplasmic adaptor subunit [Ottowia testudinis]